MSWEVLGLCSKREFRTPTRKQIVMYLADKASSDGEGIWCSKHRVARDTELSLATVKRVFREFVDEGILIETGTKSCKRGYTKVYQISVETVSLLPELDKRDEGNSTGVRLYPVHCDPPSGAGVTPVPGSPRTPNHSQTNLEPSMLDEAIAGFWERYPADRRRRFDQCKETVRLAICDGVQALDILEAAAEYARSTDKYERCRVYFSDNWLRNCQWEEFVKRQSTDAMVTEMHAMKVASQNAQWIIQRSDMCKHVSPSDAAEAIQRGLVTEHQARSAGVLE